ncbi:MAG: TonB-dependent receptor, partial [Flavipsychrobacter sp.]|nr:TonB-dependent receptor [Flavipsychrobacter sp.]
GMYGCTNNTMYLAKKLNNTANFVISGQYYYDAQPDYTKLYSNDPAYSSIPYKTGTLNTIYGPITPVKPITPLYQAPTSAYNIYAALHLDDFTFSFFTNNTKIPSSYSNNTNNAVYNNDAFIAQSIRSINATYKKALGRVVATTSLIASQYDLDPKSNYRNLYSLLEPVYKYSAASTYSVEEQLDYKFSRKLSFTGGGIYQKYFVVPQSADLDYPVNVNGNLQGMFAGTESYYRPDGLQAQFYNIQYSNSGSYLQVQYLPTAKLNFTLGARYDNNSRYGSTFNPRLGVVYKATSHTTIKVLYGSAFLSPSPSDAYSTYGAFDTPDSGKTYHASFLHLPNPGLKPVTSQNVEMSINQYLTNNFTVTVDGYYNVLNGLHAFADDNKTTQLYHNMFNGVPVDYVEVFVNEGRQQTIGGNIQLNLKHSIGNVFLNSYASVSYVDGTTQDAADGDIRSQISFIAPFMFRIGTDVKAGKFTFSPRLLVMGRQNISALKDTVGKLERLQTLPGYALLNISMRYAFGKHVSVFANITNALNQHYRSVGYNMDLNKHPTELLYGQREDPIRVMGGMNVTF